MGFWSSMARWFGFKSAQAAGNVDRASEKLAQDPTVLSFSYDERIRETSKSINYHMEAVGKMVAIQSKKENDLKAIQEDIEKKSKIMNGALAMAQARAKELQAAGTPQAEIMSDAAMLKHQGAYTDLKSTVAEKQQRQAELEADIENGKKSIQAEQRRLLDRKRGLDKLREEKPEMVARLVNAQQQIELNSMVAGIQTDNESAERLRMVKDGVAALEGKARASAVLAETNTKNAEADYLEFAQQTQAQAEFASLLNLTTATVAKEDAAKAPSEKPDTTTGVLN